MRSRREFLYVLGGAAAGIVGWVLFPESGRLTRPVSGAGAGFHPGLAKDIVVRRTSDGGELLQPDAQGREHVVCQVNGYGWQVVAGLDGARTIQDLARRLGEGLDSAQLAQTEAAVALFLATLSQAGLLAEPVFVNLYSAEVSDEPRLGQTE